MRAIAGIALLTVMAIGCGSAAPSSASSTSSSAAQATTSAADSAPLATATGAPPTPTPLPGIPRDIETAGATRLRQGGDWMQIAGGSAWVALEDGVQRLDGASGERTGLVRASAICTAMDVAFDRLWVADCDAGAVLAIDPVTATVTKTYPLGGKHAVEEGSVGAGEGYVWVAAEASTLIRIDPKTGATKVATLPLQGAGVRAGLGSVWVTVPTAARVLRIDPNDMSVLATIAAGPESRFLTIGGDSVWVQNNGDGTVTRIGADGVVKATIKASTTGVQGGDIAYGGGYVWPRISAALISKLDGVTGELLATYGPPSGSGSVAADDQAAWVSAHDVSSVWRLPLDR